ncbi:phage virion morphogenesis protein [Shewanella sp. MBTL60-007]|uniref:phage virion morphogenesis protein n=1 Tax=Shewanella sp. MBTL60-007 TaxID=2815911 RepID=UPI001BC778E1|nr:phage virion morphogenesis protein [Shewanella sp. MBTL60-007]GIU26221.1 hypothetical protein TUM3792_32750 [Shewanella sp. MBTL60-007]
MTRIRRSDPIRTKEANIANNLHYQLTSSLSGASLEFGSSEEYAAMHQFGGTDYMPAGPAGIPARPYLGLSPEDEWFVLEILGDYVLQN